MAEPHPHPASHRLVGYQLMVTRGDREKGQNSPVCTCLHTPVQRWRAQGALISPGHLPRVFLADFAEDLGGFWGLRGVCSLLPRLLSPRAHPVASPLRRNWREGSSYRANK